MGARGGHNDAQEVSHGGVIYRVVGSQHRMWKVVTLHIQGCQAETNL